MLSFTALYADEGNDCQRKSWSFGIQAGYGPSSAVTLQGLTMSDADMLYFQSRSVEPSFRTSGKISCTPYFLIYGARHFGQCRLLIDIGTHWVRQSNYHAANLSADIMAGYNFLRNGKQELNIDAGIGVYNLFNDYYYNWKGWENGRMIEHREVYLGRHNVHAFSIPLKLTYSFELAGHSWIGLFATGRYNAHKNDFCPKFTGAVGFEYKFQLFFLNSRDEKNSPACNNDM